MRGELHHRGPRGSERSGVWITVAAVVVIALLSPAPAVASTPDDPGSSAPTRVGPGPAENPEPGVTETQIGPGPNDEPSGTLVETGPEPPLTVVDPTGSTRGTPAIPVGPGPNEVPGSTAPTAVTDDGAPPPLTPTTVPGVQDPVTPTGDEHEAGAGSPLVTGGLLLSGLALLAAGAVAWLRQRSR